MQLRSLYVCVCFFYLENDSARLFRLRLAAAPMLANRLLMSPAAGVGPAAADEARDTPPRPVAPAAGGGGGGTRGFCRPNVSATSR